METSSENHKKPTLPKLRTENPKSQNNQREIKIKQIRSGVQISQHKRGPGNLWDDMRHFGNSFGEVISPWKSPPSKTTLQNNHDFCFLATVESYTPTSQNKTHFTTITLFRTFLLPFLCPFLLFYSSFSLYFYHRNSIHPLHFLSSSNDPLS